MTTTKLTATQVANARRNVATLLSSTPAGLVHLARLPHLRDDFDPAHPKLDGLRRQLSATHLSRTAHGRATIDTALRRRWQELSK